MLRKPVGTYSVCLGKPIHICGSGKEILTTSILGYSFGS